MHGKRKVYDSMRVENHTSIHRTLRKQHLRLFKKMTLGLKKEQKISAFGALTEAGVKFLAFCRH